MLCDKCIHNTEYDTCYNQNEIADFEKWIDEFGCQEFDDKGNYQKVIHAKWMLLGTAFGTLFKCSNCYNNQDNRGNYCTNCGAKMDEE